MGSQYTMPQIEPGNGLKNDSLLLITDPSILIRGVLVLVCAILKSGNFADRRMMAQRAFVAEVLVGVIPRLLLENSLGRLDL